jgi:hypothetical protein
MLRFESLGPELEVIARKNPKMLVEAVEKCFAKEGDMLEAFGPMVGLLAMREAGATILLKALDGDGKGKGAVVMASKSFGANMVMPALKQYEDPNSTEKERNTAGLAILTFADVEPVYDKVVEACKHGRYFAIPGAKKDKDGKTVVAIEDITAGVKSWWWNQVNFHYRNNTEFVEYVARKYLSEADGQDKVIQLLIDVNFGKAAPFLMKLDFNKLSDASLDVMRYATHILPSNAMLSSIIGKEKDYAAEKFLLYAAVFKAVDPKKREAKSILFSLFTFPPEYIPRFVEANVGSFTEKEKESCAFKCGYMSPDIPKETRKKVLGLLRKGASKELLGTIEYVEKGLD